MARKKNRSQKKVAPPPKEAKKENHDAPAPKKEDAPNPYAHLRFPKYNFQPGVDKKMQLIGFQQHLLKFMQEFNAIPTSGSNEEEVPTEVFIPILESCMGMAQVFLNETGQSPEDSDARLERHMSQINSMMDRIAADQKDVRELIGKP